jgi:hypothetical protein
VSSIHVSLYTELKTDLVLPCDHPATQVVEQLSIVTVLSGTFLPYVYVCVQFRWNVTTNMSDSQLCHHSMCCILLLLDFTLVLNKVNHCFPVSDPVYTRMSFNRYGSPKQLNSSNLPLLPSQIVVRMLKINIVLIPLVITKE